MIAGIIVGLLAWLSTVGRAPEPTPWVLEMHVVRWVPGQASPGTLPYRRLEQVVPQ